VREISKRRLGRLSSWPSLGDPRNSNFSTARRPNRKRILILARPTRFKRTRVVEPGPICSDQLCRRTKATDSRPNSTYVAERLERASAGKSSHSKRLKAAIKRLRQKTGPLVVLQSTIDSARPAFQLTRDSVDARDRGVLAKIHTHHHLFRWSQNIVRLRAAPTKNAAVAFPEQALLARCVRRLLPRGPTEPSYVPRRNFMEPGDVHRAHTR